MKIKTVYWILIIVFTLVGIGEYFTLKRMGWLFVDLILIIFLIGLLIFDKTK